MQWYFIKSSVKVDYIVKGIDYTSNIMSSLYLTFKKQNGKTITLQNQHDLLLPLSHAVRIGK